MDGYSVTEAASVLGVPTERVWELLARGVLSGNPEGETGMRVFLQPRPGPRADPIRDRPRNGNGGSEEPTAELSPFRELLTEFRNLTERYGQALLALGEARGEVASLRSRVDVLEARMDLRLPTSAPASSWPFAPMPADRSATAEEVETSRESLADEVGPGEEAPRRRRRSGRPDVAEIAQALARADDPSRPELPEVHPAQAAAPAPADVEAEMGQAGALDTGIVVPAEPGPVASESEPAAPAEFAGEATAVEAGIAEGVTAEPEPDAVEPEAQAIPDGDGAEPQEATEGQAAAEAGETAADIAEAAEPAFTVAQSPDLEPIPTDESLQADGDWPATAPTIDVADFVAEGEGDEPASAEYASEPLAPAEQAEAEPAANELEAPKPPEPTAEAPTSVLRELAPTDAPLETIAEQSTDAGLDAGAEPPTDREIGAAAEAFTDADAGEAAAPPMDAEFDEATPPEAADLDEAAAPPLEREVEVAAAPPVETAEESDEAPEGEEGAFAAEQDVDSPYQAAVEEPDWLSEADMGSPSEPGSDERWGSAATSAGSARASWSLWDAEPSAPTEAEAVADPTNAAEEAPAEPDVSQPESRDTDSTRVDEEPVMWLGAPSEPDAEASVDEAEDAAAEMEVAATGWQAADRESSPPPPRPRAGVDLPGGRELDDALAALRRMARGRSDDAGEPEVPPAADRGPQAERPSEGQTSEAGPAQRAYARLRRILPR